MNRVCCRAALPSSTLRSTISTCFSRRSYARASKPTAAQPISIPRLDANGSIPPAPIAQPASHTLNDANPKRIAVPTSTPSEESLVRLTLRTKAVDIDAPTLGFDSAAFPYIWLRDVCEGPDSVDQSTKQKLFKFEDIDPDVKPRDCRIDSETHELVIDWDRPLKSKGKARQGEDSQTSETSRIKLDFLRSHASHDSWRQRYSQDVTESYRTWDKSSIERNLLKIPYVKLESPQVVQAGLKSLFRDGIALLEDVPTENRSSDACSLISVAERFGSIQRTWYGDKVFSVRSLANAKNIAYTSLPLDLHMDLLHFEAPPRWQFLHCLHLHPSLQRQGVSYFVDTYKAAEILQREDGESYQILRHEKVGFEYRNDGHWTYAERPTLEHLPNDPTRLHAVNYSPPFQAPFRLRDPDDGGKDPTEKMHRLHRALSSFSRILQDPQLRFEIQLAPGECVAFDNRRILHARTGFSLPAGQQDNTDANDEVRWLMGCYLDETSVKDRLRVLRNA